MGSEAFRESNKAVWVCPKILGFNPSERWGHSACYSPGLVYVFGGCCGGVHFKEVMVLHLDTMCWSALATKGKGPGPRDSHSAVLWGKKMLVFGGTNGAKKVNDLHVLDLESHEWSEPAAVGVPPSPRESHSATLVGDDRMVVFGGSGEGVGSYLSDLHVLDLKAMAWMSLTVKGCVPSPRDSHTSVAVGEEVFVFGGDSGDRYHGDTHKFDFRTSTWSQVNPRVQGLSPGARAGHAALGIGAKMYVIGGVGEKKYHNDAWILDTESSVWYRVDVCGQAQQGRFSHTAVVAGSDIVIYGGCGEDERPLKEVLTLRLGDPSVSQYRRYNVSLRKSLGRREENGLVWILLSAQELQRDRLIKSGLQRSMPLGIGVEPNKAQIEEPSPKRSRGNIYSKLEPEPEEHSMSISQRSSQSDQEPKTAVKSFLNQPQRFRHAHDRHNVNLPTVEDPCIQERSLQSLIGAEVHGRVDGAFDSGYLMTAAVNGRVLRGVLFAPVPGIVYRRAGGGSFKGSSNERRAGSQGLGGSRAVQPSTLKSDLEGVVLTLGSGNN